GDREANEAGRRDRLGGCVAGGRLFRPGAYGARVSRVFRPLARPVCRCGTPAPVSRPDVLKKPTVHPHFPFLQDAIRCIFLSLRWEKRYEQRNEGHPGKFFCCDAAPVLPRCCGRNRFLQGGVWRCRVEPAARRGREGWSRADDDRPRDDHDRGGVAWLHKPPWFAKNASGAKTHVSILIASGSREPGRPDAGACNVVLHGSRPAILTRPLTYSSRSLRLDGSGLPVGSFFGEGHVFLAFLPPQFPGSPCEVSKISHIESRFLLPNNG